MLKRNDSVLNVLGDVRVNTSFITTQLSTSWNVRTCVPNVTHYHIPGERQYLCTICYTLPHPRRTQSRSSVLRSQSQFTLHP